MPLHLSPLEKTVVQNFRNEIKRHGGRTIKTHGENLMSLEPDIIGCLQGYLFAAEAKRDATMKPTRGQEYCLQEWTADREEGTVKIEWRMNGQVGNPLNDAKKRDFGTQNRYNQIRLKGEFGFETLPFEREYVKYRDGKKVWLSNSFFKQYTLDLAPYENNVLTLLSYDMMLGDEIKITDFNRYNPTANVQVQVIPASNFEPQWNWDNKKAAVELKFDQLYQNAVHKRC